MRPKTRRSVKRESEDPVPVFLQPSTTTDSALKLLELNGDSYRRTPDFSFLRTNVKSRSKHDQTISTFIDVQSLKLKLERNEPEIRSMGKDSWLELMNNQTSGLVSNIRGNSSIKRSSLAIADKRDRQISNFDDFSMIKVEPGQEKEYLCSLGKRHRGRPRKQSSERIAMEKEKKEEARKEKLSEEYVHVIEDPLGFRSEAEDIELDLDEEELLKDNTKLTFGTSNPQLQTKLSRRERQPYCLDFQKLINTINEAKDRANARKFVCRFCGRTFDKPSSLGGHTAKTHYGMSIKYKNRITAQVSRKAERGRLQYLKTVLPKTLAECDAN